MVKLQELIVDAGYEVYSYSGRGMYGETCLATDPGPNTMAFIADLLVAAEGMSVEEFSRLVDGALRESATDAMGTGTVLYFPMIPFEPED